ncbi:MAG: sugar phosphate isomerase/epimerase, partial [Firmicutes bacterium]|nr:sugar phosphate isomerase/epimerase [Bacillota bacterium]
EAAKKHIQWLIDCCAAVGSPIVIGPLYQSLGKFSGKGPSETEMQRITEILSELAPKAQEAGVMLVIEAINRFEAYMCNTLAQATAMAKRVNHPAVGMMVDTFHCHIEENDPHAAIREAGDAIVHVHFSENTRGTPGDGQVDFPAVMKTLREVGYDGWIVNEVFGRALPDLAAATCIWRDLFESQMQCAIQAHAYVRGVING